MKIPKVSIEEFFTLPEDEQVYFMEVCRHGAFNISVSDYLFGHVKELQLMFTKEQNFTNAWGLHHLFHISSYTISLTGEPGSA